MKIEIQKKDLLSLIGRTQNIVEKRNTMPILVNVLLEAGNNSLKAYATDLEVSLTDTSPAVIKEEGKVAVSAKSLFDLTKELLEGPIQLTKKDNNYLEIKQGKFLSKIVEIDAENINDAISKVKELYRNEEIVLDSNDYVTTEINETSIS